MVIRRVAYERLVREVRMLRVDLRERDAACTTRLRHVADSLADAQAGLLARLELAERIARNRGRQLGRVADQVATARQESDRWERNYRKLLDREGYWKRQAKRWRGRAVRERFKVPPGQLVGAALFVGGVLGVVYIVRNTN